MKSFLLDRGPIWTGLQRIGAATTTDMSSFICGVAETGVFIHDPEPVNQGSTFWLTWSQIKKVVDGMTDADP